MKINHSNNAFYIGEENDYIGIIKYRKLNGDIIIDHTYVDDNYRGKGIANLLLKELIDWVRLNNKKVIPLCSFAKKQIENNYKDVLKKED